jgi:hypothetical protein
VERVRHLLPLAIAVLSACGGGTSSDLLEAYDGGEDSRLPVNHDASAVHDATHPVDATRPADARRGADGERANDGSEARDAARPHDSTTNDAPREPDAARRSDAPHDDAEKHDAHRRRDADERRDAGQPHDATVDDATVDGAPVADAPVADAASDARTPRGAGSDAADALREADAAVDAQPDAAVDAQLDAAGDAAADSGPGCPASAPGEFASCSDVGQECVYATADCTCTSGLTGDTWSCNACPSTVPTVGSSCSVLSNGGVCVYGGEDCSCTGGTWACGTCPAATPAGGSSCSVQGIACDFPDQRCTCDPTLLNGPEWSCVGSCPGDPPTPGAACDVPTNEVCEYSTGSCSCRAPSFGASTVWACQSGT